MMLMVAANMSYFMMMMMLMVAANMSYSMMMMVLVLLLLAAGMIPILASPCGSDLPSDLINRGGGLSSIGHLNGCWGANIDGPMLSGMMMMSVLLCFTGLLF